MNVTCLLDCSPRRIRRPSQAASGEVLFLFEKGPLAHAVEHQGEHNAEEHDELGAQDERLGQSNEVLRQHLCPDDQSCMYFILYT